MPRAVELGFELLAERAAHTAEGLDLLDCLPPLVDISRYGTSRNLSLAHVNELIERLAVQASLSLPIAVRQLNEDESNHFRLAVGRAHASWSWHKWQILSWRLVAGVNRSGQYRPM